jgi:uncharacterized protein (DUF488 family)
MPPFFTIGHSTRSLAEFVALLHDSEVTVVVDVRRIPASRKYPQYGQDALRQSLGEHGFGYEHMLALGGRRSRADAGDGPSPNGFWTNESFRRYADYAMTPAFREGLDQLEEQGVGERCAIMCAEAVWWRCHRRIIADYLLAEGREVFHILGANKVIPAVRTAGAQIAGDGTLRYPADA